MPKSRKTSAKVATKASAQLKSKATSRIAKQVAGSALSQRAPKRK